MGILTTLKKLGTLSSGKNKPGPIGVDIGLSSINLCQLQQLSEHSYSVVASACIRFDGSRDALLKSPERLKQLFSRGMKNKAFKNKNIVASLTPDKLKIIPLTYNASVSDVDREIIKILKDRVEGDINDYIIDYFPVRSSAKTEEHLALVTIARHSDVLDYLQVLNHCNFNVDALDVGPAALRRLISSLYTDQPAQTFLIVNVGIETTYLTVISGRRLLFDQAVSFGEQALLKQLSQVLELPISMCLELVMQHGLKTQAKKNDQLSLENDYSQAILEILKPAFMELMEEINRVLIFTTSHTQGLPVYQICLLGSIARWPGADELLREMVNVPFSCIENNFEGVFSDNNTEGECWSDKIPELAIATGLALRGFSEHG